MDERQRIYRRLLDQVSDILRDIHEGKPEDLEGKVDPAFLKQLDELEAAVDAFAKLHDEAVESSGLSSREIDKALSGVDPTIAKGDRDLLSYAAKLGQDARKMELQIQQMKEKARKEGDLTTKEAPPEKKKTDKRRKKFKRLGGDDKWIPL